MKTTDKRIDLARGALLIASVLIAGCLEDPEAAPLDEAEGQTQSEVTLPQAYPYSPPLGLGTYPMASVLSIDSAASTNGDVMVLWRVGTGHPNNGYLLRYDAAGRVLSPLQDVGPAASHVAAGPSGTYAILSKRAEAGAYGVYVTVYNRSGGVMVPGVRVNDLATPVQLYATASIAMNASGQFVVGWTTTSGSVPNQLYVKAFSAFGGSLSPQIFVSSVTTDQQRIGAVRVALDAAANFVVSWNAGNWSFPPYSDVWARRFSSAGAALTPTFRVNTTVDGDQEGASIGMNPAGSFVILWTAKLASGTGLFGRRFDPAGAPLGAEFQISATTASWFFGPSVAVAPGGSFVTAWIDPAVTILGQVMTRGYDSAGAALGSAVQVSAATNDVPSGATMAMDPAGNHTIAWFQMASTTFTPYVRRYSTSGIAVQPIAGGQTVGPLAGPAGSWQYFKLSVPAGKPTVDITIAGGIGDADLYVRWGVLPTLSAWDGRPWLIGNNEGARMLSFPPGDWYIGVNGFAAYDALSLSAIAY